jgi:hypothetical protein
MAVLMGGTMFGFLTKLLLVALSRLNSQARLEAENLVLRQQVIVLSRSRPFQCATPNRYTRYNERTYGFEQG